MAARKGSATAEAISETATTPHGLHHSHKEVVSRMNRAAGQVRNIVAMIEAQRSCLDIAQQMHAVEAAIRSAKKTLIKDHIDHCLDAAAEVTGPDRRTAMAEFKEITKYL
ncbi:metal-sensing transcriptional repressor [Inquilinus sp. OTU3971]|uniref:metal-sensing transcriptional repressor n=1 Tax=Inquilinus sp. OTU3971 TaxID=3043855 RepID=UPI00313F2C0A